MSHPAPVRNALAWFEIPVLDVDRAQRFYETLLERPIRREQIGASQLGVFAALNACSRSSSRFAAGGSAPRNSWPSDWPSRCVPSTAMSPT